MSDTIMCSIAYLIAHLFCGVFAWGALVRAENASPPPWNEALWRGGIYITTPLCVVAACYTTVHAFMFMQPSPPNSLHWIMGSTLALSIITTEIVLRWGRKLT